MMWCLAVDVSADVWQEVTHCILDVCANVGTTKQRRTMHLVYGRICCVVLSVVVVLLDHTQNRSSLSLAFACWLCGAMLGYALLILVNLFHHIGVGLPMKLAKAEASSIRCIAG